MVFILALSSALFFGVSDFSGGFASRTKPVGAVLFTSQLCGLALVLFAGPLLFSGVPLVADLLWGAAAGLAGAGGILFLYAGLAHSVVSIVSPVAALAGAVLPLGFGLLIGDSIGGTGWAGVSCILPAVVLLGYEHQNAKNTPKQRLRAFLYGLYAGLGFGLFFIIISRTSPQAGLWPLAGARVASLFLVGTFSMIRGKKLLVGKGPGLIPTLIAGVLDMAANIAFMLAVQSGMIILVTAVTSVYPAPTVLLARLINKEAVHPLRWVGLFAAAVGVALMGIR